MRLYRCINSEYDNEYTLNIFNKKFTKVQRFMYNEMHKSEKVIDEISSVFMETETLRDMVFIAFDKYYEIDEIEKIIDKISHFMFEIIIPDTEMYGCDSLWNLNLPSQTIKRMKKDGINRISDIWRMFYINSLESVQTIYPNLSNIARVKEAVEKYVSDNPSLISGNFQRQSKFFKDERYSEIISFIRTLFDKPIKHICSFIYSDNNGNICFENEPLVKVILGTAKMFKDTKFFDICSNYKLGAITIGNFDIKYINECLVLWTKNFIMVADYENNILEVFIRSDYKDRYYPSFCKFWKTVEDFAQMWNSSTPLTIHELQNSKIPFVPYIIDGIEDLGTEYLYYDPENDGCWRNSKGRYFSRDLTNPITVKPKGRTIDTATTRLKQEKFAYGWRVLKDIGGLE